MQMTTDPVREARGLEGERCRNSHLRHSNTTSGSFRDGGAVGVGGAEFQRATDSLGINPAVTCALRCANRSIEVARLSSSLEESRSTAVFSSRHVTS